MEESERIVFPNLSVICTYIQVQKLQG